MFMVFITNLIAKGLFAYCAVKNACVNSNIVLCRYDGSTKEASFSIGLQGMAEEDTERVKQIISQTIEDIIK